MTTRTQRTAEASALALLFVVLSVLACWFDYTVWRAAHPDAPLAAWAFREPPAR